MEPRAQADQVVAVLGRRWHSDLHARASAVGARSVCRVRRARALQPQPRGQAIGQELRPATRTGEVALNLSAFVFALAVAAPSAGASKGEVAASPTATTVAAVRLEVDHSALLAQQMAD